MRVNGVGAAVVTGRMWRVALLTTAAAIGGAAQADAAVYYWQDSDTGTYSRPAPSAPVRRQKDRHQAKKTAVPEKESTKPQGPLIISISIDRQNLKIYDANGFFAESPISTGMKGHPTPMGVFSVIQKQKLHHSNIYSGAPMPFMQRITWSGIAIHAGMLPGYPASHGCIRMPMAFAVKMWNWTKMGARVVVTPGELSPSSFAHPLLLAQKVVPQPGSSEPQADAPPAPKSDKASDAGHTDTPAVTAASLELRSSVGHADSARPAMGEPQAPTSLREQTHTADAGSQMPASNRSTTMSDAGSNAAPRQDSQSDKPAAAETESATAKPAETAATDNKTAETKPPETMAAEASKKPDEAQPAANAPAQTETSASGSQNNETKQADAKAGDIKATDAKPANVKAEASAPEAPKPAEKADAAAKAATNAGASPADANKDQARLPDAAKPAAAKIDAAALAIPKRNGQIAVFVSRKDQKLYVRQNFAPLFNVPVTIAPSDRPLGTHVFTAQIDKDDANVVHWSVVTLPAPRHIARDEDDRSSRRRKMTGAAEAKEVPVPDSPTEALDRLTLPADAMARITDALSTGGSIIVSDQGINQGETGEGTDFIVSLR